MAVFLGTRTQECQRLTSQAFTVLVQVQDGAAKQLRGEEDS